MISSPAAGECSGWTSATPGSAAGSPTTPGARPGPPKDIKAIEKLVEEHVVPLVIVGQPLMLSGEPGDRARLVEQFAETLSAVLKVPGALQDERLSTVEAERG